MRHAKSDWDASYTSDHDRPLAPRGHRSANVMGRALAAWEEIPQLIVTSSAARARATAEEAARAGSWDCPIIVDPELYGTGPGPVLAVAQQHATSEERIMLVGHEPTWSMLAEQLTGARLEMRTAGVAAIDLLADTWEGLDQARGWLRFVVNPRMLFNSEWDRDDVKAGRMGGEQADLLGVSWQLVGMIDDSNAFSPVLGSVAITATFDEENRVSGSSGCNRYTGPAILEEESISIGAVAGTRMMCPDPLVMAQESRYLHLLSDVGSYRISKGVGGRAAEFFNAEGIPILEYVEMG